MSTIASFVQKRANELGLHACGTCSSETMAGIMKTRLPDWQGDILSLFPQTRGIISAALSYRHDQNLASSTATGYIARYTTCSYYRILRKRLETLARDLVREFAPGRPFKNTFKVQVNSRFHDKLAAWACGLGYVGANSLIHLPGRGPMFVLGTILISIPLPDTQQSNNSCGNCGLCRSSCPTGALQPGGVLDTSICLQHLASQEVWPERAGPLSMVQAWGTRFFGCTDCIDQCPDNRNNLYHFTDFTSAPGYIGTLIDPKTLLAMTKTEYRQRFRQNQLAAAWIPEWTLLRNALAAIYNLGAMNKIIKYAKGLDSFGWSSEEQQKIENFINYLSVL
jgi:epoxyqueuosine reductase